MLGKADVPFVGFHDFFRDGKSQTGSLPAVAGLVPHSERFKDNICNLRRNPFPVVGYTDLYTVALSSNGKAQYRPLRIMLQRVGNDIFKDTAELLGINMTVQGRFRNIRLQFKSGKRDLIVLGRQVFSGEFTDILSFQYRAEIRMLQLTVLIKGIDEFIERRGF